MEDKRKIGKLRTAIWCNSVFKRLGIEDYKIFTPPSLRAVAESNETNYDLYISPEQLPPQKKQLKLIEKYFHETDVQWDRYFLGQQTISSTTLLDEIDSLLPGSKTLFEHGHFYLFDLMLENDVQKAWGTLEKAFLSYLNKTKDKRYINREPFDDPCGIAEWDNIEPISYSTLYQISHFFHNQTHECDIRSFDQILPLIESYPILSDYKIKSIIQLELVLAYFFAKFTTNKYKGDWLGGLLFAEINAGLAQHEHMKNNLPLDIWFHSSVIRNCIGKIKNTLPEEDNAIYEALETYTKKNLTKQNKKNAVNDKKVNTEEEKELDKNRKLANLFLNTRNI